MSLTGNAYTKESTVFALAAHTTHASSSDQSAVGFPGVTIYLNITAFTGTSITFTVEGYDVSNGAYFTLLASAAKSSTGRFTLTIDPRVAVSANVAIQLAIPKRWRITPSGTITSVTYSAQAVYSN